MIVKVLLVVRVVKIVEVLLVVRVVKLVEVLLAVRVVKITEVLLAVRVVVAKLKIVEYLMMASKDYRLTNEIINLYKLII
jgi:hypothetical protein